MSLSQSAVANKLRLLKLSYEEQRLILEAGLSERHARAALRISHPQKRLDTIRFVIENKLNVQSTEQYIEELLVADAKSERRGMAEQEAGKLCASTDDAFRGEREMMDMVQALRKRVEGWNQKGRDATMCVTNGLRTIEITIRLNKS